MLLPQLSTLTMEEESSTAQQLGKAHSPMSLEDSQSDFLSDGSDDEVGDKLSAMLSDYSDEVDYLELVFMHKNLMCFDNIYINNALIDMEVYVSEAAAGEVETLLSDIAAVSQEDQDLIDILEDLLLTYLVTSSAAAVSEDDQNPFDDDATLCGCQNCSQEFEEEFSMSSCSSPAVALDGVDYPEDDLSDDSVGDCDD